MLAAVAERPAVEIVTEREPPRPYDLVGLSEIAERYSTTTSVVSNWRTRYPDFPKPYRVLRMGPIYDWVEVLDWLHNSGRI